jgi:hypothetical protein
MGAFGADLAPPFRGINASTRAYSVRGIRLATAASDWQRLVLR